MFNRRRERVCLTEVEIGVEGRYLLDGERKNLIAENQKTHEKMFQVVRNRVSEISKREY